MSVRCGGLVRPSPVAARSRSRQVTKEQRFATVGLFENSVYPGVPEALAELRAAGHELSLVTSKPATYANRIIDHFGLRQLVPHVYGAELNGERSTKAEQIAEALEVERLSPENAIMIGDREHDVLGARAQGVRAIGVTWGYGSRAELEAAGADRVVDTRAALVAAVREIFCSCRAPQSASIARDFTVVSR